MDINPYQFDLVESIETYRALGILHQGGLLARDAKLPGFFSKDNHL